MLPFFRWGNQGTERLIKLPGVIQLINVRTWLGTLTRLPPELCSYSPHHMQNYALGSIIIIYYYHYSQLRGGKDLEDVVENVEILNV